MIKIIKNGIIHVKWTCPHCGCEFICDPTDEGLMPLGEKSINCPCCNLFLCSHMTFINFSELSSPHSTTAIRRENYRRVEYPCREEL